MRDETLTTIISLIIYIAIIGGIFFGVRGLIRNFVSDDGICITITTDGSPHKYCIK